MVLPNAPFLFPGIILALLHSNVNTLICTCEGEMLMNLASAVVILMALAGAIWADSAVSGKVR